MEHILLSSILLLLSGSLIYAESATSVSSFSESHKDYVLLGHVIDVCTGDNLVCGLQCLRNEKCRSYNCFATENLNTEVCHLNNETRISRPEDFKNNQGSNYFELMQRDPKTEIANSNLICETDESRWSSDQNYGKSSDPKCNPGNKGITCSSKKNGSSSSFPWLSCKDIRDSGDSKGDGEYWIDPANDGNPFKVFCDMTTDEGGWLLVANVLMESSTPPSNPDPETSYRGMSNYDNNRMAIGSSAMNELRTHLNFTQLRFHCSKQQGRTFHITTVANSTGEAVVQYFSGQTGVRPFACNSFKRLDGDNSQLAMQCDRWGSSNVGKWGRSHIRGERMMYYQPASISGENQWNIVKDKWLCDDTGSNLVSSGDFWKVYVR